MWYDINETTIHKDQIAMFDQLKTHYAVKNNHSKERVYRNDKRLDEITKILNF